MEKNDNLNALFNRGVVILEINTNKKICIYVFPYKVFVFNFERKLFSSESATSIN